MAGDTSGLSSAAVRMPSTSELPSASFERKPSAPAWRAGGHMAREVARVLAPLLDLEAGPRVVSILAMRPTVVPGSAEDEVHAALEARDVVRIENRRVATRRCALA